MFTAVLALMTLADKTGELYLFYLAAAIHEASHLILMCLLDAKPSEILLIPGGINIIRKGYTNSFKYFVILISGPLANMFCFFISKGPFSLINLLLFIYNMLPLGGLDGGRILALFLRMFMNAQQTEFMIKMISTAVLLCFIYLFIIGIREKTPNYSILIFSLYIISSIFLKKRLKEVGD